MSQHVVHIACLQVSHNCTWRDTLLLTFGFPPFIPRIFQLHITLYVGCAVTVLYSKPLFTRRALYVQQTYFSAAFLTTSVEIFLLCWLHTLSESLFLLAFSVSTYSLAITRAKRPNVSNCATLCLSAEYPLSLLIPLSFIDCGSVLCCLALYSMWTTAALLTCMHSRRALISCENCILACIRLS